MGIIVNEIRLGAEADDGSAINAALAAVGLSRRDVKNIGIHKLSFDLRRGSIGKIYSVELETDNEEELVARLSSPSIRLRAKALMPQPQGSKAMSGRPVVIGFGPAGLFCALVLAANGYSPVVFERGGAMAERDQAVDRFFAGGELDRNTNIQFGEGGAGAYSDGKLTTRISDEKCQLVLDILEKYGAEKADLARAKPHIGTDKLKDIVINMRRAIVDMGGEVHFNCPVTGFDIRDGKLRSVKTQKGEYGCEAAVLAVGHSARDTFEQLLASGVLLEQKAFSVGVRIEHTQDMINHALYGKHSDDPRLPSGEYALAVRSNGRACYSFCMCPGGYVVPSASEEGGTVTNGMSYHSRDGQNANAAICVSCGPGDFDSIHPLAGVHFQRGLERAAFSATGGVAAPVQLFGDFAARRQSLRLGEVAPTYFRGYDFSRLDQLLPGFAYDMLLFGIRDFGKKLKGFDRPDAVLTGFETRTSSPVRITRGEDYMAKGVCGLIPCGEGAGYAGGIASAAVDGIRAAIRIMDEYAPLK